ncbi:MAG TPA: hydroxymethylbilane synthase, partial [Solirubrobacteraceae bacterium]|nr:hydroxymethylbilane synthase [Solirubrobacteraceae bacterium]
MAGPLRIGTRGSALALWQAHWVRDLLAEGGAECEIVEITTAGDRGGAAGDKARWTSELERALLDGRIDVAVHSAKDVPGELADGTALAAIPPREDPRDVICGAESLTALPAGARVGTSSLRRAAQVRAARADLEIVPVSGNVDTRLRKLAEGQADALVLALAGLRRLGREDAAGAILDELVPAAGQGALALQTRAGEERTVAALNDEVAWRCVGAERSLTLALGASCQSAVGVHAVPAEEFVVVAGVGDGLAT